MNNLAENIFINLDFIFLHVCQPFFFVVLGAEWGWEIPVFYFVLDIKGSTGLSLYN